MVQLEERLKDYLVLHFEIERKKPICIGTVERKLQHKVCVIFNDISGIIIYL